MFSGLVKCSKGHAEMSPENSEPPRPRLVVFDLDRTLWPFWVDTHVDPPFHMKTNEVFDSRGKRIRPYPEVPEVLAWLQAEGYLMAAASRTGEVRGAKQLIKLFGWEKYFKYMEIYPGCKKMHFSRFHEQSKIPLSEMIFFDDEGRNIRDLTQYGVVSILVSSSGINRHVVREGFAKFARERRPRQGK